MIDDLVKRLRSSFSKNHKEKMPEEVFLDYERERDEAANFIEKQAKYIEAYQNQTNILLRSVEMLEAKLAEKEDG